MTKEKFHFAQLFLRIAIAITMLSAVADRFGFWGKNSVWGNWDNFEKYTISLTSFLPEMLSKLAASPLVSTSCNRSGKRFCTTTREVKRQFGRQVMVVSGRIGRNKNPSQIYDLDSGRRLR